MSAPVDPTSKSEFRHNGHDGERCCSGGIPLFPRMLSKFWSGVGLDIGEPSTMIEHLLTNLHYKPCYFFHFSVIRSGFQLFLLFFLVRCGHCPQSRFGGIAGSALDRQILFLCSIVLALFSPDGGSRWADPEASGHCQLCLSV